ncbi:MAG: LysR family transcriptional regulator [Thalassobaculum sp.]|uniref:LysR family transcriptional regulator n=1 Tax=Thalassobaculum sp. TaxID=2022740 RepID=UPI0032EC22ED
MDRLSILQTFVTVAETGSFTTAAERLGLSRAMTSRHVQTLEDRLGVRLLQRTTRRVSPTEAGLGYLERARRLLADFEEAETEVRGERAAPRGTLRVNAPVSFGRTHLAGALPGFLARYPDLTVEVTVNDRVVDLIEEGFDVAIRIGRLGDSSLVARRLGTVGTWMAASPGYLARRGAPSTPGDLTGHDCIGYAYSADVTRLVHADGREASVRFDGPLTANNGDLVTEAAAGGAGIVMQPDFILAPYLADGRLVPVLPDWSRQDLGVYAVHHQSRHVAAKVRAFVDHLVERFRDSPWSIPPPAVRPPTR